MNPPVDYEKLYHAFRQVSRLVHSSQTIEEVCRRVVWKTSEVLDARGAILRILNPNTRLFDVVAAYGLGERFQKKSSVPMEEMVADLGGTDHVVVMEDLWKARRVDNPQEKWDLGIRMLLDVPLTIERDIVGMIRLYLAQKRAFFEEEKEFMIYIAEQCACSIQRIRLIEKQTASYNALVLQTEKLSALGRMAAGIAHEINNPLAGVLLYSSNLVKKVPDGSPLKEGLNIIIQETRRCKAIIQDLLEFSRDKEPEKTSTNINDIANRALSILDNEFRLRHIELEQNLSDDVVNGMFNAHQLEQVFVNLLLNAAQAIENKGRIRLKTQKSPSGKEIIVEISDNGCGIQEEHLTKIFEPFFSTKKNGSGLGLAVSYGIILGHRGNMDITSEPGKGTCVRIELPIIEHVS